MTAPVSTSMRRVFRSSLCSLPPFANTKTSRKALPKSPRKIASMAEESGMYLRNIPSVPKISIEDISAM